MSYIPSFNLLEDTKRAMVVAQGDSNELRRTHSIQSGFWPSAASIKYQFNNKGFLTEKVEGSCLRQAWYSMKGYTSTEAADPKMQDVWDLGSAAEEIYKQRFQAVPEYRVLFPDFFGNKLRFANPKTGLRGEADLVLQHMDTGSIFGVEMKSYYRPWAALEVAGYEATKAHYGSLMPYIKVDDPRRSQQPFPKVTNLMQSMLYLEEFWEGKVSIKLWKLIYVARDKGPSAEFDVTLTDYKGKRCAIVNGTVIPWLNLEGIHARFAELKVFLDKNLLPPRDYNPEYDDLEVFKLVEAGKLAKWVENKIKAGETHRDFQCDYCPFLSRCLGEANDYASF